MKYYFDTTGLVKIYHREIGSDQVTDKKLVKLVKQAGFSVLIPNGTALQ